MLFGKIMFRCDRLQLGCGRSTRVPESLRLTFDVMRLFGTSFEFHTSITRYDYVYVNLKAKYAENSV
jgi:hypothetical protein